MPIRLFEHIGGFCEEYRNGFEDVDLCVRVSRSGAKMCCEPKSRVYHLEGQSAGRHDNESYNSALAIRRAIPYMYPDAGDLAEQAGFSWSENSRGKFVVELRKEQKKEIQSCLAESKSANTIYGLLMDYPCWYEGYSFLANRLIDSGRSFEALDWLILRLRLNTTQAVLIEVAKIYGRLGLKEAAKDLLGNIERHNVAGGGGCVR
ncbi:hypothetical protein JCM16814_15350 [Desulfobaculum senezii]